jgi:hypothetical protein
MWPDRGTSPRLRNFLRRDYADQRLLIEAAARLTALRLYLGLIGAERQPRLYGRASTPARGEEANRTIRLSPAQRRTAARIGWAIARAERALPFDVVCLPQALVARRMLGRRGIASVMFFGVERGKPIDQVVTHAWLLAGEVPVTGVRQASRYKTFASYASGAAD